MDKFQSRNIPLQDTPIADEKETDKLKLPPSPVFDRKNHNLDRNTKENLVAIEKDFSKLGIGEKEQKEQKVGDWNSNPLYHSSEYGKDLFSEKQDFSPSKEWTFDQNAANTDTLETKDQQGESNDFGGDSGSSSYKSYGGDDRQDQGTSTTQFGEEKKVGEASSGIQYAMNKGYRDFSEGIESSEVGDSLESDRHLEKNKQGLGSPLRRSSYEMREMESSDWDFSQDKKAESNNNQFTKREDNSTSDFANNTATSYNSTSNNDYVNTTTPSDLKPTELKENKVEKNLSGQLANSNTATNYNSTSNNDYVNTTTPSDLKPTELKENKLEEKDLATDNTSHHQDSATTDNTAGFGNTHFADFESSPKKNLNPAAEKPLENQNLSKDTPTVEGEAAKSGATEEKVEDNQVGTSWRSGVEIPINEDEDEETKKKPFTQKVKEGWTNFTHDVKEGWSHVKEAFMGDEKKEKAAEYKESN